MKTHVSGSPRVTLRVILLFATLLAVNHVAAQPERTVTNEYEILEALPNRVRERTESTRLEMESALLSRHVSARSYIVSLSKRWEPGQKVTVAFKGGTKELHAKIAAATADWIALANLHLDFGLNAATGEYRRWSPTDTNPAANIRISFDQGGYYSYVGTDCLTLAAPGEETMNFSRFDRGLPARWRAVVLHEFGHALGFEHEHQLPDSPCDFRWEDDAGYQPTRDQYNQFVPDAQGRFPGLYTVLSGPPNSWSREQIDFNLRQLKPSNAFGTSGFDKNSIMKYYFPAWMFASGTGSLCFTKEENSELSPLDQAGVFAAYPKESNARNLAVAIRANAIRELKALDRNLSAKTKNHIRELK